MCTHYKCSDKNLPLKPSQKHRVKLKLKHSQSEKLYIGSHVSRVMQTEKKDKNNRPKRTRTEKFYRFLVKWPKRIGIILVFLFLLIAFLIQLPAVQNYIKDKTIQKLKSELHTEISISAFKFSLLNGFWLKDLYVEDRQQDTLLYAQKVQVSLEEGALSLLHNELRINEIQLKKANIYWHRPADSLAYNGQFILDYFKGDKPKTKPKLSLALKRITLDEVHFRKEDERTQKNMDAFLYYGEILVDSIDLNQNRFVLNNVELDHPLFSTFKHIPKFVDSTSTPTQTSTKPFSIAIKNLSLSSGRFSSDNFAKSLTRDTLLIHVVDFNHLDLSDINLNIKHFNFQDQKLSTTINQLSLKEQSGFEIQRLAAKKLTLDNQETRVEGFLLQTPKQSLDEGTKIKNFLSLKYNSFQAFKNFKEDVFLKLNLTKSKIAIRDILYFAKKLDNNKFFRLHRNKTINISGNLFGKVANPKANNLELSLGNLSLLGNLKANNILDKAHASLNLDIKQLHTDVHTLQMLLPDFQPPKSVFSLGQLRFKGKFEGFFKDFVAFGELETDIGTIQGDMNLDIKNGTEQAKYSGKLSVDDFDLGKWFDNNKLGRITFHSSVKEGGGIRLHNAHAILEGTIQHLTYKNYEYKDIFLNGKLEKNFFDGTLKSHNQDFDFDFNGAVDFTDSIAKYNFDSKVKKLDLYKLNLAKKPLIITGEFDLNLKGKNAKTLTGAALVKNVRLIDKTDSYRLDSANISLDLADPNNKFLIIESGLVSAKLEGIFDLPTIPKAIKADIVTRNPAFAKKLNIQLPTDSIPTQDFKFAISIPNTLNITKLLNIKVDTFTGVSLSGNFNNLQKAFSISSSVDGIYMGVKAIRSSFLDINAKPNNLKVNAYIFETQLNTKKKLPPISVNLNIHPDTLAFRIKSSNISNVLKNVRFNGIILPKDKYYQLQFNPSKIQVAQDLWQINSDNYLRFSNDFLEAKNINFVADDRQLQLTTPTPNSLNLKLKNFDLSFINSLENYQNLQFTGPFVANVQFNDIKNKKDLQLNIDADTLNINDLSYGRLKLRASMADFKTPLDVQLNVGQNELLTTKGYIYFGKKPIRWRGETIRPKSISLLGGLQDFPFAIMEDIIPKGISETSGVFDGYIKIKGPLTGPEFDGQANIKNGEITIDYLKTHYYINNQKIKITTNLFDASGQHIVDKFGNVALIDGGLTHRRFKNFGLNVRIHSDKFLVLDTKKGDNPLYYGQVLAEAYAGFSGDFHQPHLRVIGKSLKNTNLNLLFTDEKQIGQNSFVKFVSFAEERRKSQEKEVETTVATGLDIDMQLDLTEDADIQLIFDETSGDIIKSKGHGSFNMYYSRSGEFTMNGQYVITQGKYLFTLMNFINKPFIIEPGGTITWEKDPMGATLNLSALYQGLSAPVYSLIKDELTSFGTSNDKTEAQRPSQIDLGLRLTGPMLKPNITFSIEIPNLIGNNKNYVASKLNLIQNDPNELNRQVFGLLVFGGFLPPGTALGLQEDGAIGTGLASTISELLSSQFALYVNSLLSDIIGTGKIYSGTEVDVALNFYQSYGITENIVQSKAFQFNLKNHFFNNRVTVQFGGNVGLSQNVFNPSASDFAGDILIEIILTKNRRYRAQIYNRFSPDYTGNSTRMKTGVGLSYQREFNSLKELLKGVKKAVKDK